MLALAVICFVVLIAVGIWFYYFCFLSPQAKGTREAPEVRLLKTSTSLTPRLEKYLRGLETLRAAEILAANGDSIPEALWEEIGAMFAGAGRDREFADLLENPDPEIRARGAELLGRMRIPGGAGSLVTALGDKNEEVRLAAAAALVRLKDPSVAPLLAKALGKPGKLLPARVAEVLVSLGSEAVQPLLEEIENSGEDGRCLICQVLGQLGDSRALPELVGLLESSDSSRVRACAAEALGNFSGDEENSRTVHSLIAALKDEAWEVRARAAEALGQIGSRQSASALADAAENDDDWNVRTIAKAALNNLSPGTASS